MSESNGNSRRRNVEDQDQEEEAPSELNLHGYDVGVIRANKPAPMKRLIYYFEIHAIGKGHIAIGFTTKTFQMPGREAISRGYHCSDGVLYGRHDKEKDSGPIFTSGDVVGAGINNAVQEFFFTKNGQLVCSYHNDLRAPLFPTIVVHGQNEEVPANFGQKPFTFDLKDFEAQERMKQQQKIEEISVSPKVSYRIVHSYLLHYGYEDTFNPFDVPPSYIAQENGIDEQEITYALNHRKTLQQLIRNGDIDVAFGKLREWYPQIVEDNTSAICFLLHCQKFIELVRVGATEEAIKYGGTEFPRFSGLRVFEDLVVDCLALLAYKRPVESPEGYLLKDSQREVVAHTVNAMILSTNPNMKEESKGCLHSYLERLLKQQLTACCLERRSLNGEQGEGF
ncbi:Ran-binding protein 10 [Spatholobus suberectus]|nr:Ran-binding protein 10 [Spatholobus suberectus]